DNDPDIAGEGLRPDLAFARPQPGLQAAAGPVLLGLDLPDRAADAAREALDLEPGRGGRRQDQFQPAAQGLGLDAAAAGQRQGQAGVAGHRTEDQPLQHVGLDVDVPGHRLDLHPAPDPAAQADVAADRLRAQILRVQRRLQVAADAGQPGLAGTGIAHHHVAADAVHLQPPAADAADLHRRADGVHVHRGPRRHPDPKLGRLAAIAAAPAEPSAAATRIADPDAECVLVALQLEPFHALTKAAGDADLRPVPGLDLDAALDVVDAHLAVGD